jgi:hypothetical protein
MSIYIISGFITLFLIIIIFNRNFRIFLVQNKLYILMVFLCCIMLITIFCFISIVIYDDIDRCLDKGGSWDKEHNVCLY